MVAFSLCGDFNSQHCDNNSHIWRHDMSCTSCTLSFSALIVRVDHITPRKSDKDSLQCRKTSCLPCTGGVLIWWDFTPSVSFADSSPGGGAHYHFRWHRLAAARSRHGSDSPPDCHSLPCRHFAALKGSRVEFLLTLGRCGHRPLRNAHFQTLEYLWCFKTKNDRPNRSGRNII